MKIGYFLSCEEWGPRDLVAQAIKARDNQIGPDRDAFFDAYRQHVLPQLG